MSMHILGGLSGGPEACAAVGQDRASLTQSSSLPAYAEPSEPAERAVLRNNKWNTGDL